MNSYSLKKGFSGLRVIVTSTIVGTAFLVALSFLARDRPYYAGRTKALANAKSVVGGLLSFKSDYGNYPCHETRARLEQDGIDHLPSGTSANAYLAQLVATDHIDTEKAFFAPDVAGAVEGDRIKGSPDRLLSPGENSFAYVMALDGKPLTDIRTNTPLILTPVIRNEETEPTFDPQPYYGTYVCGLFDGSSIVGEIDENGHAISTGRGSFFQTGPDSLFGKDTPILKYPLGLE